MSSIPVQVVGAYSYKVKTSPINIQAHPTIKQDVKLTSGLIVNIRVEGNQKRIHLESQVLIVNNLGMDLIIFVKTLLQDESSLTEDQILQVKTHDMARVPLTWIICETNLSLYIKVGNRS